MKKYVLLFGLFAVTACSSKNDVILGTWEVNNSIYRASYQIIKEGKGFSGEVLHYDDGTTQYSQQKENKRYLFKNAQKNDSMYVDGISGASKKTENAPARTISLKVKHKDTLEVTSYILNHPIKELWTRKNN